MGSGVFSAGGQNLLNLIAKINVLIFYFFLHCMILQDKVCTSKFKVSKKVTNRSSLPKYNKNDVYSNNFFHGENCL